MKLHCLPPRLATATTSRLTGLVAAPLPRESAHKRGYDHKWRKARERYLRAHPLCVFCESKGHVTAATVVDHIVPHNGNMKLFWDSENNWQGLCYHHHNSDKQRMEKNYAPEIHANRKK